MSRERIARTVRTIGVTLVAASVRKELTRPPAEREWHGQLAGFIPYEFRLPTVDRIRERCWNPDDPGVLTLHVFGVGWSVNIGRLIRLLGR